MSWVVMQQLAFAHDHIHVHVLVVEVIQPNKLVPVLVLEENSNNLSMSPAYSDVQAVAILLV